jgi:hypothetical protein
MKFEIHIIEYNKFYTIEICMALLLLIVYCSL